MAMVWFFHTKREVNKELEKIKHSFAEIKTSFKDTDFKIEDIKKTMLTKKEVELMIKEAMLNLKSGANYEQNSEPNQTPNYERVILQRAKKTRPEVLKTAIRGYLAEGKTTTEIFKIIVEEKRLVSKTQFYHYLSLVRAEPRTEVRTKVRTEHNQGV